MEEKAAKRADFSDYKDKLQKRKTEGKIYTKHQSIGLLIAELLDDFAHKSLYIKLAREKNPEDLLRIAKDISQMANVKSKGGYFMSIVHNTNKNQPNKFNKFGRQLSN